jgi:MinD-like ATPase involved in chromosome partitioning or flagellar assembly
MSLVLSVLTTKDGQGSSTFALSIACALAERRRVMMVDADMSGTGNLADLLALDCGTLGVGNLFGPRLLSAAAVEAQAVPVRRRPRLRVVPGLPGYPGPEVAEFLPRLRPALDSLSDEVVVLDLGAALAHPGQESSRRAAEAISAVSHRVFVALVDSPARLVGSVRVLRAAQPPQAELVILETRGNALRAAIDRTIAQNLPGLRISARLPWDPRHAARAEDEARPLVFPGALKGLRLVPEVQPNGGRVR